MIVSCLAVEFEKDPTAMRIEHALPPYQHCTSAGARIVGYQQGQTAFEKASKS